MQSKSLARLLVIAAMAAFAVLSLGSSWAAADEHEGSTSVQGDNISSGGEATSGDVEGSQDSNISAGPSSTTPDGVAVSRQRGDNHVNVEQDTEVKSGDSVAGSQVTGVVNDGGHTTVDNTNISNGATATSGNVSANVTTTVNAGPTAVSNGGPALASQTGDNFMSSHQSTVVASGDAVAGSQVTGVVGAGSFDITGDNLSWDSTAVSGDVTATVVAVANAGPFAATTGDDAVAIARQVGDNDAVLSQSTHVGSGDAVAGSTVVGAVGGGDGLVEGFNFSTNATAVTGDVNATVVAIVTAGPQATASAAGGNAVALASQRGNSAVAASQEVGAGSGDAVAGSQITGLVSQEEGHLEVLNQQFSEAAFAQSGEVNAVVDAEITAGPAANADSVTGNAVATARQTGDNVLSADQTVNVGSGDAVAGSQVTGVVGAGDVLVENTNFVLDDAVALSGDVNATTTAIVNAGPTANADTIVALDANAVALARQTGDNVVAASQNVDVASGDAVAGSQVTGVVADGNVEVVNDNFTLAPVVALSGDVNATTTAVVGAGPAANASFVVGVDANAVATASQRGDNVADVAQNVNVGSGDAVAGSQVTGVVAGGDVLVQNTNFTLAPAVALSGDVNATTTAVVNAGPAANAFFDVGVNANAIALASQTGDNVLSARQNVDVASGDAVAGGQVTGVVAGGNVEIANDNFTLEPAVALSGAVNADTFAVVGAGPAANASFVVGVDANAVATASQRGDNVADVAQNVNVGSGDAVAGAQVTGVVAGGDVLIENANVTLAPVLALSGDVNATTTAVVNAGPAANAAAIVAVDANLIALASQTGDNVLSAVQTVDVASGDAVAGAQVTGVVANGDVTVANDNLTLAPAIALSGDVAADTAAFVTAGPLADATPLVAVGTDAVATASQRGDNHAHVDQRTTLASGDAVSASQVTGVVAGSGEVLIEGTNLSLDEASFAQSGSVIGFQTATVAAGPAAFTPAGVVITSQTGDSFLSGGQSLVFASGDAVVASQVVGSVSQGGVTASGADDTASILGSDATLFDSVEGGAVLAESGVAIV